MLAPIALKKNGWGLTQGRRSSLCICLQDHTNLRGSQVTSQLLGRRSSQMEPLQSRNVSV